MTDNESLAKKPERMKHRNEKKRDRFFVFRNVLNILFMIGAVVGVVLYLNSSDHTVATAIILTSIVLKFTECVLRMMR
jgi:archaellum biogenesis protein FlaJ (TadC family)